MEIKKQIELMFKEKQATVVLPTPPKINRTGANYFVCNFEGCGATIKHRRNLVRHWQLHQKAKYYCFSCGYQSMNREQITQHHCDPNTPKFDCDECDCGKKFTVLQHLNRHLLLIHGTRLFVWCPTCRSYFARIDALKKHQSRCHQSDSISSSLLGNTSTTRNESSSSIANISAITTSTITSVTTKNKISVNNSTERVSSVINIQQQSNGQLVGTSNSRRDENHFTSSSNTGNKQTTVVNLNGSSLNSTIPTSNNQINIDENLFKTQSALINKTPILLDNSGVSNAFTNNFTLVRNSVISRGSTSNNMINVGEQLQSTLNDNANRIKLLNSNIMLTSNNKVQQYIGTGISNNERDNLNNPFDAIAIREDYLYRNKKIRFGELIEKDRVLKH